MNIQTNGRAKCIVAHPTKILQRPHGKKKVAALLFLAISFWGFSRFYMPKSAVSVSLLV